jgi:fucose 4-O-acetylase-like acetyltransferase
VPRALAQAGTSARRADLDRVKGLAILLVVFGHLVARRGPVGVGWYEPLRIGVYLFHMPLFMYLSGYVTFLSGAARTPMPVWPRLLRRRAARLLGPFLMFGVAILVGKLLLARLAPVDNVPQDLWHGLRALVWDTDHSPATSVWYIGVLFVYSIATPPLLALRAGAVVLTVCAVVLFLLPLPPVLYLDRIGTYFVFFVAGGLAADAGRRWLRIVDTMWPAALAGLLLAALPVALGWLRFDWSEGSQAFPYKWAMLTAGLLSLPALHGLVRHGPAARSVSLIVLGRYVFVIYLLNTVFIGLAKVLMLRIVTWDGAHFLPFAAVLMAAGTLGPMMTKRWVLRRLPMLDRATD